MILDPAAGTHARCLHPVPTGRVHCDAGVAGVAPSCRAMLPRHTCVCSLSCNYIFAPAYHLLHFRPLRYGWRGCSLLPIVMRGRWLGQARCSSMHKSNDYRRQGGSHGPRGHCSACTCCSCHTRRHRYRVMQQSPCSSLHEPQPHTPAPPSQSLKQSSRALRRCLMQMCPHTA